MGSDNESSLLDKLQSGDLTEIHHRFSTYLIPFSAVLKPLAPAKKSKKQPKSSSSSTEDELRSLAKKFLTFIHRTLSIIPKRLLETPKIDPDSALQLFDVYRLGISCLESISCVLVCKPYAVHIHRIRLVRCLVTWERYADAQSEGFLVLESLGTILSGNLGAKGGRLKGRVIPDIGKGDVDQDLALYVVDLVVSLVKCVASNQSKVDIEYRRILSMVDEIQPWSRVIDSNTYDKYHRGLVTYMSKCASHLVQEAVLFDGNLVHRFCLRTISEFSKSSMKDQMNKFAQKICCYLLSQPDKGVSSKVGTVIGVLESLASECKIGLENIIVGFLELVSDCASGCRAATVDFCVAVAACFNKLADLFTQDHLSPIDLIMRLYAIGLSIGNSHDQSRRYDSTVPTTGKDMSLTLFLLNEDDMLQNLRITLNLLGHHFNISDPGIQKHSIVEYNHEASTSTDNRTYMACYFHALIFLCKPLSEFINSERKEVLFGNEDYLIHIGKLCCIQDAFHHFSCVFLSFRGSEREKDTYDECSNTVLNVAAAAFTLSFKTKQNMKETVYFLRHVISDWMHANGLKFLFISLYNIGIALYRNRMLIEASKALRLSCTAAWAHVKMLVKRRVECRIDLSEEAISDTVTDACTKSAFMLDVVYQCDSHKVDRIIKDCLRSWSDVVKNFSNHIPSPMALVKQWVKIECKRLKIVDGEQSTTDLHSMLPEASKKACGVLLEQELQAYTEAEYLNPELCRRMQAALLQEIYTATDSYLPKSRILIAKGRLSRACGVEGLDDSIKYLSDAISILSNLESNHSSKEVCHELANAYCLRALCAHDAGQKSPNSKLVLLDIRKALELWKHVGHTHIDDQPPAMSQNKFILLSQVADLLSLKGYIHSDIYEMMISWFTSKNIPMEKYLPILWQSRRLGHALCTSPMNDSFIQTLEKHCELFKSTKSWISCMDAQTNSSVSNESFCSLALKVGFQQSFSVTLAPSSLGCNKDHATESCITVDEVKQAASDLITNAPLSSNSDFLAACLYYDLGERLITDGFPTKALFYAKEAHRLRRRLFQSKFMYSMEKLNEIVNENGDVIQKSCNCLKSFHLHSSVATAAWSNDNAKSHFEDCVLTPWNVLQCYLESTLQMGTVHEMIGNASDAETHLLWGKTISSFQGLSFFVVSFSAVLGKLYRKQRHWVLAEEELKSAKQMLVNNNDDTYDPFSCLKCRLVLEVKLEQQLGDLSRNRYNSGSDKELSFAEDTYRSAIKRLNCSEWKNCVSNAEEASANSSFFGDIFLYSGSDASNSLCHSATNHTEKGLPSKVGGQETTNKPKLSKKSKKAAKPLPEKQETNMRMTRSRVLSSQKRNEYVSHDTHNGFAKESNITHAYVRHDACGEKGRLQAVGCSVADCGCGFHCVIDKIKSWHRVPSLVMKSGSLTDCIQMKWEFTRRRLLLRLLTGIGKCSWLRNDIHNAHEVFSDAVTVLDLIGKNGFLDNFRVEHAVLLYSVCWTSLKSSCGKTNIVKCCDLPCIPIPKLVLWLKLAFILSREVPVLFQKVSRLLSVLYMSGLQVVSDEPLSVSQWASYFHQASLGTHLNHQLFSHTVKQKVPISTDDESSCLSSLTSLNHLSCRLAPESLEDLQEFVISFYQGLPCTTIICISMLRDAEATLLSELLLYTPPICAWIMLSRLNSNGEPVIKILPVNSISEVSDDAEDSISGNMFEVKDPVKQWCCPWGSTVVDDVAPVFKVILEENYISSASFPLDDTKENRSLWWAWRRRLDQRLGKFLRDMEASWFGHCRYLFLGEPCKQQKLYGAKHACQREDCSFREPVILVLDFDVQMLPWENLPILRNQEVYRMPSVASISSTFSRCCQHGETIDKHSSVFPVIDPLDAYYLLNPSGDLTNTEVEFGNWFRDQNLEGRTGTAPTIEELTVALKSHDLFMYFGHGSGTQYIPGHEVQKLDRCAATLLMGCSSGSLSLNGSYTPRGAPLYYILAGSPLIVANLWEVTDKDIDRFSKAMLDAWLGERSATSSDSAQCKEITEKLKTMTISDDCKSRPKLGSFIAQARNACNLPFLIGAAPVCYGIPTGIRRKDL